MITLQVLFQDISHCKNVGPKKLPLMKRIGIHTILDLLFFQPIRIFEFPLMQSQDFKFISKSKECASIRVCNIKINRSTSVNKKHFILRGKIADDIEHDHPCQTLNHIDIEMVFFHINSVRSITSSFGIVSGKYEKTITNQRVLLKFIHPTFSRVETNQRISQYSLPYGLTSNDIVKFIKSIDIPEIDEWIPLKIVERFNFPTWKEAILNLHFSKNDEQYKLAINRLAFDELLFHYLHNQTTTQKCRIYSPNESIRQEFLQNYGIKELTPSQRNALHTIDKDLANNLITYRVLHGDVGSGKTIIAFLSILSFAEHDVQIAFICPTEILARQHYENFIKTIQKMTLIKITTTLLTGSMKEKEKTKIREGIFSNQIQVIFGTHSLFSNKIKFHNLEYVIIDELHKFGVSQRNAIYEKGINKQVNMLIMSATPIPRTLEHTLSGFINLSKIEQKLPDRFEIKTYIIHKNKEESLLNHIFDKIKNEECGYWVCPSIKENEEMSSIESRIEIFKRSKQIDISCISILHSEIPEDEKNSIMQKFKEGDKKLILCTTVIETGIDIPNATFIVVENAERFGLSQLHQLRGRVGRNDKQSVCFLLCNAFGQKIKERLNIMRETNDGFVIATKDLELRGAGEFYGTAQSGEFKIFNFADLDRHSELSREAKETVESYDDQQFISLQKFMNQITYQI
ncbi:ATP-dependent DNA helicase RecG [Candidatus Gromoviella agglomerans]|uniref:ATP-dependent DNA helicase RecG n=1 Tax=Candidatus Gromoviella agglomerans TaxID=2806609 RepID=UPI001E2E97C0|nr:ATP-dependent DNA helicase RecG [Candidatus Gromoviella agglomerans]UFX98398.1 ATP-dependent DNA helicase RecG [Candidatus Gromoviella agglomerans]